MARSHIRLVLDPRASLADVGIEACRDGPPALFSLQRLATARGFVAQKTGITEIMTTDMSAEWVVAALAGDRTIRIRDHGASAEIRSAPIELLAEFSFERRRFRLDGRGGLTQESEPQVLFELDPSCVAWIPSGLIPRLCAFARRLGLEVELLDVGPAPVDATVFPSGRLTAEREQIASVLAGSRRGVLLAGSRAERFALLGLILDLFRTGRRMIVTKTRSEARSLSALLRSCRGEPIGCFTQQYTRSDVGIQVGTAGSLVLADASVVILTDATQAAHQRVSRQLAQLDRQRVYGLLDDRVELSHCDRLTIEGYIGPLLGRTGPATGGSVNVCAVFADWRGKERPDEPLGLSWKRQSIWRNDERNEAIARIATALANRDMAALWELGVFLDDQPVGRLPDEPRVVVLVESLEHARSLSHKLPGWAIGRADEAGRPRATAKSSRGDDGSRIGIMTWLHAQDQGRIIADAVIRADAAPWAFEWALGLPSTRGEEAWSVMLVDLADHQDRTAREATRARCLDYQRRGWIS